MGTSSSPSTLPCWRRRTADGRASFAFVLPVQPGWAGNLASITLFGTGGLVTLDDDTDLPMTILLDQGAYDDTWDSRQTDCVFPLL